jgi:hypothetical protein
MQWLARMVAVLLLVALAAAQPAAQVLAFSASPTLPSAGCHGDMGRHHSSPTTPAPSRYQCCVNGHHAAIPCAVFSGHRVFALTSGIDMGMSLALRSSQLPSFVSFAPSSSPPGGTPLRI